MKIRIIRLALLSVGALSAYSDSINVNLGTAGTFGVLAGSTVTNTGITTVNGDVGVWPGTAITGFPPGIVSGGTLQGGDGSAMQAQADFAAAYNFAAGETCGTPLTGQDLGGLTLTTGVYCFSSSAQLTGVLTLNDLGDPNAVFVFQIGSTLTTASASSVVFSNGDHDNHVSWQVGSSATLGTTTTFEGNILALTSITLTTGVDTADGRALALNGAVTMDTNVVSFDSTDGTATPESATSTLFGIGVGLVVCGCWRAKSRPGRLLESNENGSPV